MAGKGFQMGDHRFLEPGEDGPVFRMDMPKTQILGAPPPTYLRGCVREATKDSAAATELLKGMFCGHGEPTLTVYDIVIDGADELELSVVSDELVEECQANYALIAVRPAASLKPWTIIFDRTWEDRQTMLRGVSQREVTPEESAVLDEGSIRARVAIGFEYPSEAESVDDPSWITIDILADGEDAPSCIADAELA